MCRREVNDLTTADFAKTVDDAVELYEVAPPHLKAAVFSLAVFLEVEAEHSLSNYVAATRPQHEATYKAGIEKLQYIYEQYRWGKAQGLLPERK